MRALVAAMVAASVLLAVDGCVEDTACGICDDKNLVLQILAGPNYALEQVRIVSPECEGDRCPAPFERASYFIDSVGPCEETDAAKASPRGVEEYCKIAPVVVSSGLQFVFNNLLDPTCIELVRKRPDNPNLFETYDWKTRILSIEGPVTRYNGDWRSGAASAPDTMTRGVNLSCIDNAALGAECDALQQVGDGDGFSLVPRKVAYSPVITAPRGQWDDRAIGEASEIDCDTPADGTDTCCSQCDWSLGVAVAKYGAADRIACDPLGDRLLDCAAFQVQVDRTDEPPCEESPDVSCVDAAVPLADRMRELHPYNRIGALAERLGPACSSNSECRDLAGLGLPGAECIGTNAAGAACALDLGDPECTTGHCRAPWFVECRAAPDTTGPGGFCVDARHDVDAAAACWVGAGFPRCDQDGNCELAPDGTRLSACDSDADGKLTAAECCNDGQACDPVYDNGLESLVRYERKATMPEVPRATGCGDAFEVSQCPEGATQCGCKTIDDQLICAVCDAEGSRCDACNTHNGDCQNCDPNGDDCQDCSKAVAHACLIQPQVRPVIEQTCTSAEQERRVYAVNFVTKLGGVIYAPALKGVEWRPADLGGTPRAVVESCAQERGLIAARNITDGWRAHDDAGLAVEHAGEWDLGMCSGQTYKVVFADRGKHEEYVRDKVGNTLEGKSVYTFETPDFHVVPESGFPNDSLRIGACDTFSLSFSNKYDLSPGNLDKLELHDATGGAVGTKVAGGPDCARDREDKLVRPDAVPCLTIDVSDQPNGVVHARVDPVQFGSVLVPGHEYELFAPGAGALPRNAEQKDIDAYSSSDYAAAFWDVCGMPLVLTDDNGETEYRYLFTVDPPRCEDDADGDGIELSCDNAPDSYNPTQPDADFDGVGDAIDLCPASPELASETGDTDRDGVGNGCDNCARALNRYNDLAGTLALAPELYVRNVPSQADADRDGIGDACDNCPTVANCEGYDPAHPWRLGDPIDRDAGTCQHDGDYDMVGDACTDLRSDIAAGVVGIGDEDDFDQDGLVNRADACPRQPELEWIECGDAGECPAGRECVEDLDPETASVCNHLDGDGDGIGDSCDTCPSSMNPMQTVDGGLQEDDADGDFIGASCELGDACATEAGPRPLAFYAIAVAGQCCTTLLVADGDALYERTSGRPLVDPDGLPVRIACADASCRALPKNLAELPGVLTLPFGCEDALAAAGSSLDANAPIDTDDTHGDLDVLWNLQCQLAPVDQDYDGLGDGCDLCPFAFDPDNTPYTDLTGKLWPHDGAACSGVHAASDDCDAPGNDEGGSDEGDASSSSSDGS